MKVYDSSTGDVRIPSEWWPLIDALAIHLETEPYKAVLHLVSQGLKRELTPQVIESAMENQQVYLLKLKNQLGVDLG